MKCFGERRQHQTIMTFNSAMWSRLNFPSWEISALMFCFSVVLDLGRLCLESLSWAVFLVRADFSNFTRSISSSSVVEVGRVYSLSRHRFCPLFTHSFVFRTSVSLFLYLLAVVFFSWLLALWSSGWDSCRSVCCAELGSEVRWACHITRHRTHNNPDKPTTEHTTGIM